MLSDVPKTFVGSRVRQLRSERGFSQAALAQMLEISPSYLNQIEHDVRPLTVAVLLRITEVFGVDATFFASQDDTRLVAELREVTMDRDLDIDVDPAEVADMVSAHPTLARAMVNLHRRYRITTAQLAAATEDRFSDGSGSGLDHDAARGGARLLLPAAELSARARHRRRGSHHRPAHAPRRPRPRSVRPAAKPCTACTSCERTDLGDTVLHRYDPATKTLEIGSHLSSGQQVFKMAAELAYLEFGDLIDKLVEEGKFTSEESTHAGPARAGQLLRRGDGAAVRAVPRRRREVPLRRRAALGVLLGQLRDDRHRLSTLQRPSMRGVPFSFVRVDRAGNMSKRQSATGFHFSSSGGTCPLWNVYETFANPGKILVQIAQMPDGRNYMWVARTVERRASRYGQPGKTFAIGLGLRTSARTPARLLGGTGLVG